MIITAATWVLALVTLQRLSEVVIANSNTRALIAKGGVETGAAHYPVMVLLHASWLASLWWFGWNNPIVWSLLAVYGALQFFRIWILATLGRRWTTRIITVPGETLVARGPYRFVKHPNYLLVLLEVPLLPLALNLPWLALLFGLLNIAMLIWRIRVENAALGGSA
jgi:methyltransferase